MMKYEVTTCVPGLSKDTYYTQTYCVNGVEVHRGCLVLKRWDTIAVIYNERSWSKVELSNETK